MQRRKNVAAAEPGECQLTKMQISDRICNYGFAEIGDILNFLSCCCGKCPDCCDYIYIRSKLGVCLSVHDDQSGYFIPLRELACELDCFVRLRLRTIL